MKKIMHLSFYRRRSKRIGLVGIAFLLLTLTVNSQTLDFQNKITIPLSDGTQVTLFGKAESMSSNYTNEYYYLPTNLRLSTKTDGTPEFLFLMYTTEEKAEAGGVQGALMHFLMEWGLTASQEKELQAKLVAKIQDLSKTSPQFKKVISPKVMGAINLRSFPEESFRIISGTLTNTKFTPNLITTGRAPLLPGSKIAVAATMEKNGAQLLAATFEKSRSITDVSVNLLFKYDVMMPRVEGKITVDWTKIQKFFEEVSRGYEHKDKDNKTLPWHNSLRDDIITDTERESLISYFQQTKLISINLDIQETDNPVAQQVVDAYLEYFTSSIADKEFVKNEDPAPIVPGEPYKPNKNLYQYHFSKTKMEKRFERGTETYNLTMRLPMTQEMSVTENLASWYDGVKDNEKCVAFVNLNDPFFEHRDIIFILDAYVEEMIQNQELTYVTVNILKERSTGRNFEDEMTFDLDYLKKEGSKASLSYARENDTKADVYKYKCQWSFKDAELYPENPQWISGSWQPVPLKPPIIPRVITFDADLDEMKELGITNATLELRYLKFGKEHVTNVKLVVSRGQSTVDQTIYTDSDHPGYAYRVILTHRDREIGKIALDWDAINDDYVFASIPRELKDNDADFIEKAKKAAEVIISSSEGEVKKEDEILNKFKDVLDIIYN